MGWGNVYPAAYPPIYQNPYQAQNLYAQPVQIPAANPPAPALQPTQLSGANQPQGLSLPTRYAEIIQVEDEGVVDRFQIGAGQSQMFMNKSETFVAVKTAYQDGTGYTVDYYDKRPPAPPAPIFDPEEYVRKDELETLVSAALAAQAAQSTKRATNKKEEA